MGWRRLSSWLITACVLSLLTATPSAADVRPFEVREYQQDYGVSQPIAERNLETQVRGSGIVGQLKVVLDKRYAGVWFDHKTGEFVVPLLPGSDSAAVASVLADDGLGMKYRVTPAASSWEDLEAAQAQVSESLQEQISARLVQVSLDPRTNAVLVREAKALDKADEAALQRLAANDAAKATIEPESVQRFNSGPLACKTSAPRACGRPLRGGVSLTRNTEAFHQVGECSVGFKATVNGNRFVLTAGHCASAFSSWGSEDAGENFHPIGNVAESKFPGGDWAKITADGSSYWDLSPWPSEVAHYWEDQERPINYEAWSYLGQYVCHSGTQSGTSCGGVSALNVTAPYGVNHLTEVKGVCALGGDSGGPVFAGNTALGLLSGGDLDFPECERPILYVEITEATDALGVSVGARLGEPPIVPDDDDAPGPRVIVDKNGTLHVFYRDANGNLGHRWLAKGSESWGQETQPASIASSSVPHVISKESGLHVFYRTTNGNLGNYWISYGTEWWGQEIQPASLSTDPGLIVDSSGTLHVFYRDTNGNLGHRWINSGAAWWGQETQPASIASSSIPELIVDKNGMLHVFYRDANGNLGHRWLAKGSETWGQEIQPASIAPSSAPRVIAKNNGLYVFYRTTNGNLGNHWISYGTEWWGQETQVASLSADPSVIVDANETLHVFYRDANGNLGHRWINDGAEWWGQETQPASISAEPRLLADKNGMLHVFYRDANGNLGHRWLAKGSETWGQEIQPASLSADPRVIAKNNGIHVFYRTTNGNLGNHWISYGTEWWGQEIQPASIASRPPLVIMGKAAELDGDSAVVRASIDAEGSPTDYYFEYGPTASYGSKQPIPARRLGNGVGGIDISETLGGLMPATTYHYRVVASSPEGTVEGTDATFTTASSFPAVVTKAATEVGATQAMLNGSIDPEGFATTYRFEYGKTKSYGSSTTSMSAGSGNQAVSVSQPITSLAPETVYHYRVVATNSQGVARGKDMVFAPMPNVEAKLNGLAVTQLFDGSQASQASFNTNWAALGWASGAGAKGQDTSLGWAPISAYPTENGAYFSTSAADSGSGVAAAAKLAQRPGASGGHFSLWLDMSTPGGTRAGYELRFTETEANVYDVNLARWQGGAETVLASQESYSLGQGSSLALIDRGALVTAWVDAGSGFSQLLVAEDSTFSGGRAGLAAVGENTRLSSYRFSTLLPQSTGVEARWYLRNFNTPGFANVEFIYGGSDLLAVTGDWNGDGIDTPGAYKQSTGQWFLRNSNTGGVGENSFTYGGCCDLLPVTGDWNNDGIDTPGLYKRSTGQWFLRNTNTGGVANIEFTYGGGNETRPLAGDWNNDGIDTIGMFKMQTLSDVWLLRNSNTSGIAHLEFTYGSGFAMIPFVGDWNNDGIDTPGLYTQNGEWFLRNTNTAGVANLEFTYGGGASSRPIAGDWNKDSTDTVGMVR
jgi:hypothetical protein